MQNEYEANINGDKIAWVDIPPKGLLKNRKVKVKIIIDENISLNEKRGKQMAEILENISKTGIKSIKNPSAWQKEARKERVLKR